MSNYKKGEIIEYGSYPYGENGEKRPLEWVVIESTDKAALLITRNAIDTRPYKKKLASTDDERRYDCAWKNSDARSWLNEEFIFSAFSEEERAMIVPTKTEIDCLDKAFYLSYNEFHSYMPEKYIYTQATPYAAKQGYAAIRFGTDVFDGASSLHGEQYDSTKLEKGICKDWWLRTLGEDKASVQTVFAEGDFFNDWAAKYGFEYLKSSFIYFGSCASSPIYSRGQYGALCLYVASRPAMWVYTSLTEEEKRELVKEERRRHEAEERKRLVEEERRRRAEEKRKRCEAEERRRRAEEERKRREAEERRFRAEEERKRREAEENRRRIEEERKRRELQRERRNMNLCQHCGGSFKGLFKKTCRLCGKGKDY